MFPQLADRYGCQSITRHVSGAGERLRLGMGVRVQRSRPLLEGTRKVASPIPAKKPLQIFTEVEKRERGKMKNGGRQDGGPDRDG